MNIVDLTPADAALIDTLLDGHLLRVMSAVISDGNDLDVQVDRSDNGQYVIMIHLTDGDLVVTSEEFLLPVERLHGRAHLLMVYLWTCGLVESSGRRRVRQEREIDAAYTRHGLPRPRR